MTGNDLKTSLGLRLEDAAESVFTAQVKMDAVNSAQRLVVSLADNKYLQELETIADGKAVTSGACTYTIAFGSSLPIRGGITGIYDEDNDKWCTMIDVSDVKELENSYTNGSTSSPLAYVFNETIYVKPTTISEIDIWYLQSPTDFDYSSNSSMTSPCVLNIAIQESVLNFAEAQLWRMDSKPDRGNTAYNNGISIIKALNERSLVDKSKNIAVKDR